MFGRHAKSCHNIYDVRDLRRSLLEQSPKIDQYFPVVLPGGRQDELCTFTRTKLLFITELGVDQFIFANTMSLLISRLKLLSLFHHDVFIPSHLYVVHCDSESKSIVFTIPLFFFAQGGSQCFFKQT